MNKAEKEALRAIDIPMDDSNSDSDEDEDEDEDNVKAMSPDTRNQVVSRDMDACDSSDFPCKWFHSYVFE